MSKATQLQEALDHAEANVQHMATWSQRQLAERLELVHIQSQLAEEKKDTAALQLLEVWRSQLIAARLFKTEHGIADVPSEIKQAVAEIEIARMQTDERREVRRDDQATPRAVRKPALQSQQAENQLGLF